MNKYPEPGAGSGNSITAQKINQKRISPYGSKYQTAYSSNRNSKTNLIAEDIYQTDY
jgi:hypothetical protein